MTLTMFDSTTVSQIPADARYVAGYVNGAIIKPTWPDIVRLFPNATKLSIAVTRAADAECLDIETGDATNADAPGWVNRQIARGIQRPVLYTSASNVNALLAVLTQHGFSRSQVRIWSAHYGHGEHICGIGCSFPRADGTQWTSTAMGRNLDQSLLADDFFGVKVMPEFNPPIVVEPVVSALACPSGGAWTLAASGAVDAWAGAPYCGGANGKPYFVNRSAAKFVPLTPEELAAEKRYAFVDTAGERYAYPE